ncbi:MAG: 4-hydroxybenzoate octaprenyltransferase [Pseudomonadota bacterium]
MTDTSETTPTVDIEDAPLSEPTPRTGPADAVPVTVLGDLPDQARPYISLSRIDRPVGIWLLLLPCWIGLAFSRMATGFQAIDLIWIILFGIGAVAMRGAGCTWNDITDRDIDAGVARTAGRPIPSGEVSLNQAYLWLAAQLAVGFLVWLTLPGFAKLVALLALPLVAAYPYMKRITYWPQAWLGLTFNWGVLVAAAVTGNFSLAVVILFLGLALWTVAYDTIYALQDREDDALIGVRSTARLFGDRVIIGTFCFMLAAAMAIALAGYLAEAGRMGAVAALAFIAHGLWQIARLKQSGEADALAVFKSNVWAGAIILGGFTIAALF